MFVDKARITVKAGDGGNGCCSFRREKFIPKGGPDGGDGGDGGNIILEAVDSEQSLVDFLYTRHYTADRGPHGKGKNMHGRKADDVVLKVPLGTIVSDADSNEVLADLDSAGMRVVVAKGGRGGRGNTRFASSTNRAPRQCEPGEEGEERDLVLEALNALQIVADSLHRIDAAYRIHHD